MKKLPYIPNKNLYAAVMGACSYIRETGYFNKAITYYADKYNVDANEVKKYVRIAQGNGQRIASQKANKKFKWYAVVLLKDYYFANDDGEYASWNWDESEKAKNTVVEVMRATSIENVKKRFNGNTYSWKSFEFPHTTWTLIDSIESATKTDAQRNKVQLERKYCAPSKR